MARVLYITRNGLLEPLGQSQVLSYLRGLSISSKITLITFEKKEDTKNFGSFDSLKQECKSLGIRWRPQRFRYRPKLIAPTWSMIVFFVLCLRIIQKDSIQLIHARSYIPAAVAWVVWKITGVPFIFDMRALWPEELITASRLRRDSYLHKLIVLFERLCLRDAAAVVTLTNASIQYLNNEYPEELRHQKLVVIPTCVDLKKFSPLLSPDSKKRKAPVYGCIGTILSGWFRADWLAEWFYELAKHDSYSTFELVTRDDPDRVRLLIDPKGILNERLKVFSCTPQEMPSVIKKHTVSTMFYEGEAISELGRSPTRLAEVLACGIPVVANFGVGDVADTIIENRVGIVLNGIEPLSISNAIVELNQLLCESDLQDRCRKVAETIFSLEAGTDVYQKLYIDITE